MEIEDIHIRPTTNIFDPACTTHKMFGKTGIYKTAHRLNLRPDTESDITAYSLEVYVNGVLRLILPYKKHEEKNVIKAASDTIKLILEVEKEIDVLP